MAIDRSECLQGFSAAFKPSVQAEEINQYLGDFRRTLKSIMVFGGKLVHFWIMPWDGVIESVRTVQQIAGGAGANGCDVQVLDPVAGLSSVYTAAGDFVGLDGAAAAGDESINFPTGGVAGTIAALAVCSDGVSRVKLPKGTLIYAVSSSAGTQEVIITIAKELRVRV